MRWWKSCTPKGGGISRALPLLRLDAERCWGRWEFRLRKIPRFSFYRSEVFFSTEAKEVRFFFLLKQEKWIFSSTKAREVRYFFYWSKRSEGFLEIFFLLLRNTGTHTHAEIHDKSLINKGHILNPLKLEYEIRTFVEFFLFSFLFIYFYFTRGRRTKPIKTKTSS